MQCRLKCSGVVHTDVCHFLEMPQKISRVGAQVEGWEVNCPVKRRTEQDASGCDLRFKSGDAPVHVCQLSIPVNVGEEFWAGLMGAWCVHFLGFSVFVNYCRTCWGSWGLCGFSRCLSCWSVWEPLPQVHPAVLVSGALGILMGAAASACGPGTWTHHLEMRRPSPTR